MTGASYGLGILRSAKAVLLIDWPSRAVPDGLARLGLVVVANEGPGAHRRYELTEGGGIRVSHCDRPSSTDLVYAYRPLAEVGDIAQQARELGALAVWMDHLSDRDALAARAIVESAGVGLVTSPPISEAAAAVGAKRRGATA